MKSFIALIALVVLLPASAQAWWNTDWTVRKKITLDTQAAGITAEAASVPLLVRLSSGNFDFLSARQDGSDIRFVAQDDATPLKFGSSGVFVGISRPEYLGRPALARLLREEEDSNGSRRKTCWRNTATSLTHKVLYPPSSGQWEVSVA